MEYSITRRSIVYYSPFSYRRKYWSKIMTSQMKSKAFTQPGIKKNGNRRGRWHAQIGRIGGGDNGRDCGVPNFLPPCVKTWKPCVSLDQYFHFPLKGKRMRIVVVVVIFLTWFCTITRLNSVKNTNFGLDNKNSFLMHWKMVFWVTDKFSIKWSFLKMPFSARKCIFCHIPKWTYMY